MTLKSTFPSTIGHVMSHPVLFPQSYPNTQTHTHHIHLSIKSLCFIGIPGTQRYYPCEPANCNKQKSLWYITNHLPILSLHSSSPWMNEVNHPCGTTYGAILRVSIHWCGPSFIKLPSREDAWSVKSKLMIWVLQQGLDWSQPQHNQITIALSLKWVEYSLV